MEDMFNCMSVLHFMIGGNTPKTILHLKASDKWQLIDWQKAKRIVKSLQARIVKAVKAEEWNNVRGLQRLLTNSTSAKVLAVRRVTENTGKRTVGIDGEKWDTPEKKYQAIEQLNARGYKAKAVRRIKIPKSNGKTRPLGIPTMKDRAMQALYLLGLDPVSETLADSTSYGFRPYRNCADAVNKCHKLLVKKVSPKWILEGDIKGCFDNISHEWLLKNIPMEKGILRQWLKSGYLEKQQLFPTKEGTPQGSVISPTLANMVLDGMEKAIDEGMQIKRKNREGWHKNPFKIHLVRYADDFVITGNSKEVLEERVKPIIDNFLAERGLELSKEKTFITHIDEGFDFLGKTIRKFKGKLIIKPSKKNIATFLKKIQETIHRNRTAKTVNLLYLLNNKIRGWTMYHRSDNSKNTFSYIDHKIWKMTWKWALRRHGTRKNKLWVAKRYYRTHEGRKWTMFDYDENQNLVTLMQANKVKIKYHTHIRGTANPYDPVDELYFEQRNDRKVFEKIAGRKMLTFLHSKQKGVCPVCQQKITVQTGWNVHHIIPKHLGGKFIYENLVMLHPVCHRQVHSAHNKVAATAAALSKSDKR